MGVVALANKRVKEVGAGIDSGVVAFAVGAPVWVCMVFHDERSFVHTVSVRAAKAGDGCDCTVAQTDRCIPQHPHVRFALGIERGIAGFLKAEFVLKQKVWILMKKVCQWCPICSGIIKDGEIIWDWF